MAKKRKTDKFYPLQRKDVDSLFASSPPPEPMQYDFGRQNHFVHPTKPPKTILRWFRVLLDSEASGASASGDIPEEDLDNNNMTRREDTVCVTQTQSAEPEPSMWGVELTRYNCEVRYRQRREAYELIRFPAVKSDADLAAIGDDLKDERVLCWWNSNSGHWEAITGEGGVEEAVQPTECCVEFLVSCDDRTNECCLIDGFMLRVDPNATTNFCSPVKCRTPVWLWCYQGPGPNQDVDIEVNWCGFGRLIKRGHACILGTRDVYGIDCGDCVPECPEPGDEIQGSIEVPVECIVSPHNFTIRCVMKDPLNPDAVDPGWWGEFELTGSYPVIGHQVPVESMVVNGQLVQDIFVVIGCRSGGNLDDYRFADLVYIEQGAGYIQYSGSYEVKDGIATTEGTVPITDENGCVLQCERVYRYGIFFQCDPLDGRLFDGKIYRILRSPMVGLTTTDSCHDPDIQVPTPDDRVNGGDAMTFTSSCYAMSIGTIDQNLSTDGFTVDVELVNEVNNAVLIGMRPFAYETFGGCQSWQTLIPYNGEDLIPTCADPPTTEFVRFIIDWSNSLECDE